MSLTDDDLPRAWWEGRPCDPLPVAPACDDSDLPSLAAWRRLAPEAA